MDQKYFRIPFALSGDKTTIPDAIDPSGAVSFDAGYGFDYERDRATDPAAKAIERAKMNYLFGAITEALAALQQSGAPEWITSADNGGTAFPYSAGSIVKYRPSPSDPWATYVSLTNNNVQTPGGSNWRNLATLAPLASPALTGTPTVPTAAPGTNTTQAASTAFVQAVLASIPDGIGVSQNWQNLTASRFKGVTYTNSTGRPIQIFFDLYDDGSSSGITLNINGISWTTGDPGGFSTSIIPFSFIIPNGNTYSISGGCTIRRWLELR